MTRALPLPARFVLLVLVVVVVPLGLMGYWLTGVAARSGEDLLRSRLKQTNASVTAEMSANWMSPRAALLSFADAEALQIALRAVAGGPLVSPPPSGLVARFEALPSSVQELTVRGADGSPLWHFTRALSQLPTFGVRVPIHARPRGAPLGELEARLGSDAVLGPGGVLGSAIGAVVAVIDPEDGASLRALPLDPSVLADTRFQWEGETWAAEHRVLLDPRLDVISAAPLAEFSTPFEAAAGRGLGLLLAVAVVATALATVLTGRMTRSLARLARAADAVSRGDLSAQVPVVGGDEVGRVAQAFNGMTESLKRTLEELSQREALAMVGRFASELAHEVRNPLTSIKVDLQHVEEQLPEGSELREVQHGALEEVGRLDRTVAGVLQIARSGRIALDEVDVREPLSAAAHAVEPTMAAVGATLCLDLTSAPLIVFGDRDALQQLFTNLLANAAQAVGAGGRIEVAATADAGLVVVTVDDDGPGITPEDLARVREPFFSTRSEGTGLGLAIADRIAAAHHAKLQIDSAPGRGTRVEVRFAAFGGRSG